MKRRPSCILYSFLDECEDRLCVLLQTSKQAQTPARTNNDDRGNESQMGKQGLTPPPPTEKQHSPSRTRSRKDSKSPGGLKTNKKTHGQQGPVIKGRRGRSGNPRSNTVAATATAASKDPVTMAEANPDDDVKLEQPTIDSEETSEDGRDAVCTCFLS